MNYFWIHCTLTSEFWNAASIHFRVLERIKHRFFNCMHPIHIPRTRKKAFRVQWIIFEFIAPSFQSAGTQPASISECWIASKTNFRVLETNLKVLKTNFKVLKIDFRLLEPNFNVPILEKAKIRSVLFVSQVISKTICRLAADVSTKSIQRGMIIVQCFKLLTSHSNLIWYPYC